LAGLTANPVAILLFSKKSDMKILIIDPHYSAFLDDFYKKNPQVAQKDYEQQKTAIFAQCFGTGNFYSLNLKKLGVKAQEIIPNNETLQNQWAKEHNLKNFLPAFLNKIPKFGNYAVSAWEYRVLEKQIKNFSPDVLYCQNLSWPSADFLKKIKKSARIKLIVGQVACPTIFDKKKLAGFDLILTSFPHFVEKFKKINIASEYFKIGFEPSILEKLKKLPKTYDAVFVGGISRHHEAFIEIFDYLAKNTNIDFWGYGAKKISAGSPILPKHHGEAWGIDMYNILHNSKISVNRHIDAAENNANNMRLYESTGVGTMLITDYKDNLNELFEIGKEIETYKTKEELLEKIKYYLEHDDQRQKIALAGQARTLKDHTYQKRMVELINILNKYL
jgi:glycosyltransferase involved in cell wall biosynthesis